MEEEKPKTMEIKRTKAEIAFQKMQEKMASNSCRNVHSGDTESYHVILLAAN